MAQGARTIFDNAWFTLERPAFEKIRNWSDGTLTVALLFLAIVLVFVALSNRTLLKAIVFGWIVLP
jgi:hypothetical protein